MIRKEFQARFSFIILCFFLLVVILGEKVTGNAEPRFKKSSEPFGINPQPTDARPITPGKGGAPKINPSQRNNFPDLLDAFRSIPQRERSKKEVLEMAENLNSTFCFYGSPSSIIPTQMQNLAKYKVLVLNTTGKQGSWKENDIKKLKELNPSIKILSYVSVGAADKSDKEEFERIVLPLMKKDPSLAGKNEGELKELIWMNQKKFEENKANPNFLEGAQINLSNPIVREEWLKFKKKRISDSLKNNPGGGVFFDDSDTVQTYIDRYNDRDKYPDWNAQNQHPELKTWFDAAKNFGILYNHCAKHAASESKKFGKDPKKEPVVYQNRGFVMRDPGAYNTHNGTWQNDPAPLAAVQKMLNGTTNSTSFEDMRLDERDKWKERIILALKETRLVNIINYKEADIEGRRNMTDDELRTLLNECISEVAGGPLKGKYSEMELKKLISVKYYQHRELGNVGNIAPPESFNL